MPDLLRQGAQAGSARTVSEVGFGFASETSPETKQNRNSLQVHNNEPDWGFGERQRLESGRSAHS